MLKHLSKYCCWLYSLSLLFNEDENDDMFLTSHIFNAVLQNHEMLDSNRNWYWLALLEVYYRKNHDPIIKYGLQASQELLIFNQTFNTDFDFKLLIEASMTTLQLLELHILL